MESPTPPLHFLAVFNRNTNTYWEPITFEEGYRQKDSYDPPLYFTAEGIQLIINELEDIELPPLVIAISNETLSKASFEGDIFSRDSEIYANFFPDDFAQGEGPNSVMPIRRFSHIRDKTIHYPQGPFPIIMIGFEDLITRYEEDKTQGYSLYQFWDSSIWHRYVYFPTRNPQLGRQNLTRVLRKISSYHQKKLYQTAVAQEFLEFQCRKLANSYIIKLPPDDVGDWGHGDFIHPFHFHSETVLEYKASVELEEKVKGYTWRALIIDDYFKAPLRLKNGEKDNIKRKQPHPNSKIEIIKPLASVKGEIVLDILNEEAEDPQTDYLSTAKRWMNSCRGVDLILLDYFFGIYPLVNEEKDPLNPENQKELYGNALINDMCEKKELMKCNSFKKFWVFPISVFEYAFESHLRGKGQNTVNSKIEWSTGADPINTPELFRFLLFGFLITQKETHGLNLSFFLNDLTKKTERLGNEIEGLQKIMLETYPSVIKLHTNLNTLMDLAKKKEEPSTTNTGLNSLRGLENRSKFAETYLDQLCLGNPSLRDQLETLNYTLQQLWYNLAYGAGLEAPKMLMDLQRVKNLFDLLFKQPGEGPYQKGKEKLNQGRPEVEALIEKIYKYIQHII